MKIGKLLSPGRFLAYTVTALPILALLLLGFLWLGQHHLGWTFAVALLVCTVMGAGLHRLMDRHERAQLHLPVTQADSNWPDAQQGAWRKVEAISTGLDPKDWPLTDVNRLLRLGQKTVSVVATHYHPDTEQPVLELTVPHLLRIVELASRDLGKEIREHVPFSDRLSIGDIVIGARWKTHADRAIDWWRLIRPLIDWTDAVLKEAREHVQAKALAVVQSQVHAWLLSEYVRRLGFYAIEVYSGRLRFSDEDAVPTVAIPESEPLILKPLEILILGKTNAGKSSLVNALFGEVRAVADALPATSVFTSYWLAPTPGKLAARITDSPALDTVPTDELLAAAAQADLILWVIAANRADREHDRIALDAIRADAISHPERFPAPVIPVLSRIDLLEPRDEWQPPYDLADATRQKSQRIVAAISAVAADLEITPDRLIPTCLERGRVYNVDEGVWPALIKCEVEAAQVRMTRSLIEAKRAEQTALLLKQLKLLSQKIWTLPSKARDAVVSTGTAAE